jgi:hypothetical protein
MNVAKGLRKFRIPLFEERMNEAALAGERRFVSVADCEALANDIVEGNLQRLAEQQALGGEWLLFAEHDGKRYYLCVCTHDKSQHEHVRATIDAVCCKEFPFLTSILGPEEGGLTHE